MASVTLSSVDKYYGETRALSRVSLDIDDGEFTVFVGPSGCGKSTLLRAIAGLENISSGTINIGETNVTQTAPSERDVAMVFQTYALYPHMTVFGNMEFGMKVNGVSLDERKKNVLEAARILQLEGYLKRKPAELSGGQRQRVAIGRAIVRNPKVFLFDEPLSNLDAKLRVQMRIELKSLHSELGATMIYVTHDQVEAMTMADKIVVMNNGVIEQIGSPLDLYHNPQSEFVASFLGSPGMNFLEVKVHEGSVSVAGNQVAEYSGSAPVSRIGFRPELVGITAPGQGKLQTVVNVKEVLGNEAYLYTRHIETGSEIVIKTDGTDSHSPGETLGLNLPMEQLHLFGPDGLAVVD